MPDHVHGIIVLEGKGEAFAEFANASPLQPAQPRGTQSGSIGAIIQNFKSVSTRKINQSRDTAGTPMWHRNYHEHIIRNEKSLNAIRKYIADNPANWSHDEENPVNIRHKAVAL